MKTKHQSSVRTRDNRETKIPQRTYPRFNYHYIGTSDLLLDRCDCTSAGEGPALEIILGTNVIWLLVLRPCVLLLWSREHLFVDLGSHLMLTIAAVFAPILPNQKIRRQMSDGIFQIESSEVTKTVDVD